eukprot:10333905-Alexandrium_andersonii.AAC.1
MVRRWSGGGRRPREGSVHVGAAKTAPVRNSSRHPAYFPDFALNCGEAAAQTTRPTKAPRASRTNPDQL